MISAEGLVKAYGQTRALGGLDLEVAEGTVFAMLGPNGSGKTTAVRIFTTLLHPDEGRAVVAGCDVVRDAERLRAQIGLAGQYAAVDEYLTGFENLEMVGRLYHAPRRQARERADQLLVQFDLVDAARRPVKTYSGGMRRRLDLAASLVAAPPVLFLDEPTTGLDPRSRLALWETIAELRSGGATLLLTTQYLEEADRLADRIAVLDRGRAIATGTADQLKDQVGGDRIEVAVAPGADLGRVAAVIGPFLSGEATRDPAAARVSGPVTGGAGRLAGVVRELDAAGIDIADLSLHRPTLDDVFLTLTGHAAQDEPAAQESVRGRRRKSA